MLPHRAVARRSPVIFVPTILDPLPDIAVHVAEAPAIRRICSDLAGATQPRIAVVSILQRNRVAERIPGVRAGPAGIFPSASEGSR
jgi:hypothetical protein